MVFNLTCRRFSLYKMSSIYRRPANIVLSVERVEKIFSLKKGCRRFFVIEGLSKEGRVVCSFQSIKDLQKFFSIQRRRLKPSSYRNPEKGVHFQEVQKMACRYLSAIDGLVEGILCVEGLYKLFSLQKVCKRPIKDPIPKEDLKKAEIYVVSLPSKQV